jgi:hypothetical protein
VGEGE